VKSKVSLNAPAGLLYAGGRGVPNNANETGNEQRSVVNLSPRGGIAWTCTATAVLAVVRSYAMAYRLHGGEYSHNIDANAPPVGNRSL